MTKILSDTKGTPAGLDKQVQFNDNGKFAGDSGLTYNKTTNVLTLDDLTVNNNLKNLMSTCKVTEPTFTINADTTKFDIGSFVARFLDNYSDTQNPTVTILTYAGSTANTVTNIATQDSTIITMDKNGTIIQRLVTPTAPQIRDEVIIGSLIHTNRTTISNATPIGGTGAHDIASSISDFSTSLGPINRSGNVFSGNATSGLKINKSAGETFQIGINENIDNQSPNVTVNAALTAATFLYGWRDGAGGFRIIQTDTVIPGRFDDGTGGTTQPNGVMNNNKWQLIRLFRTIVSNISILEFGQVEYISLAAAIAAKGDSVISNPSFATTQFRGWLVVRGGATDLKLDTDALFIEAGKLSETSTGSSAGTSTTTLQGAYNNSTQPQITTDTTRGSVQIKRGSAADTDTVFEVLNGAGTSVASIKGSGVSAFSGDVTVPDEAYDATNWNGSLEVPTKNAIRDKLETIDTASGTYTPVRSAEVNMDANVTMTEAQYMRVGSTVTVSGRFTANPTLVAADTSFEMTIPVASNFGAAEDAAGVAFTGSVAGLGADITAVVANDTVKVDWNSDGDAASRTWSYTFTYQII